jgi:hypothetical protein
VQAVALTIDRLADDARPRADGPAAGLARLRALQVLWQQHYCRNRRSSAPWVADDQLPVSNRAPGTLARD